MLSDKTLEILKTLNIGVGDKILILNDGGSMRNTVPVGSTWTIKAITEYISHNSHDINVQFEETSLSKFRIYGTYDNHKTDRYKGYWKKVIPEVINNYSIF